MMKGFEPAHAVHIHASLVYIENLKFMVFISCWENQLFAMSPFQTICLVYVGAYRVSSVGRATILCYDSMNLAVRVGYPQGSIVQVHGDLLMAVVKIYVCV